MPYKDPVKARAANKRCYEARREQRGAAHKHYYESHREQIALSTKRYREAHRDEYNAYQKRYQDEHPEQTSMALKKYRDAHREERNAYSVAYRRLHPETVRAKDNRRRARKRGAPINTFTSQEWAAIKLAYNFRCAYCQRKAKLTQDHVLPLSKGGNHCASNILPACLDCNLKKGVKDAPTYQPVLFLLQEAI